MTCKNYKFGDNHGGFPFQLSWQMDEGRVMRMDERAVIVFDKNAGKGVLDLFDKTVNDEGIIVEKQDPNIHVLAVDGTELTLEEFGGVKRGSEVFIKSDVVSLFRLAGR